MSDITVILNAHREGILAGPSVTSARAAIARAEAEGLKVEMIAVLDRSDATTTACLRQALGGLAPIEEVDLGDPARSRNHGVTLARGRFTAFLDADDLWSENWLTAAHAAARTRPEVIWHSHGNIVFGEERHMWWHVDSEGALAAPDYMTWANYWDALSFAATAIYRATPFRPNDLKLGFGHEDWHWNVATLAKGHPHKPVPGTLHFKRRRRGSQMAEVEKHDATIWWD